MIGKKETDLKKSFEQFQNALEFSVNRVIRFSCIFFLLLLFLFNSDFEAFRINFQLSYICFKYFINHFLYHAIQCLFIYMHLQRKELH